MSCIRWSLLLLSACQVARQPPGSFSRRILPLDNQQLTALEAFGEFLPEEHFTSPITLLLYYSELSCGTCTSKALTEMKNLHEHYGNRVNFLLVVRGQNSVELANLRRMGKVGYPILLENETTSLGLPHTLMGIHDQTKNQVVGWTSLSPNQSIHGQAMAELREMLGRLLAVYGLRETASTGKPDVLPVSGG